MNIFKFIQLIRKTRGLSSGVKRKLFSPSTPFFISNFLHTISRPFRIHFSSYHSYIFYCDTIIPQRAIFPHKKNPPWTARTNYDRPPRARDRTWRVSSRKWYKPRGQCSPGRSRSSTWTRPGRISRATPISSTAGRLKIIWQYIVSNEMEAIDCNTTAKTVLLYSLYRS